MAKPVLQKIPKRSDIKPFKIKYYYKRHDPDFEARMYDVLVVYKQVSLQFDDSGNIIISEDRPIIHIISCDEKPGIQAIATTSDDLRPDATHGYVTHDYEYKRLGTLSLIAGETIPVVSESHKSSDFICLLEK